MAREAAAVAARSRRCAREGGIVTVGSRARERWIALGSSWSVATLEMRWLRTAGDRVGLAGFGHRWHWLWRWSPSQQRPRAALARCMAPAPALQRAMWIATGLVTSPAKQCLRRLPLQLDRHTAVRPRLWAHCPPDSFCLSINH